MYEELAEIIAVTSILIKFGHDDILEDRKLFIAFLNELGLRHNGRYLTSASIQKMTQEITVKQKSKLIEEFLVGHEPLYRRLAQVDVI